MFEPPKQGFEGILLCLIHIQEDVVWICLNLLYKGWVHLNKAPIWEDDFGMLEPSHICDFFFDFN
jgi:hypothetical protein